MPIIKIWCLPPCEEEKLTALHKDIVQSVCAVSELGLKDENDMTCLFPSDMMQYGLGTEIVIEIERLHCSAARTPEVKARLARYVGQAVANHFPEAKVECFVSTLNPADEFWSSTERRTNEGQGS